MNRGVQTSIQDSGFISLELLDHMVVLLLIFEDPPYCSPQWLHQFTFPPTVHKGSPFSTSSPTLDISCLFDDSHSDKCEVISYCSFGLKPLMVSVVEHLFMDLLSIYMSSLGKKVFKFLCPFLIQLFCFCFCFCC